MSDDKSAKKKESPKTSGFFIASWFWVVGAVFFYLPYYYGGVPQYLDIVFSILGWVSLIISFIGTSIELSRLVKNEGFSYWGACLVFIVPAIALQYSISSFENQYLINIIKTINVLLVFIGSGLFLYGLSFFFEKKDNSVNDGATINSGTKEHKFKRVFETSISILIALITLATAILQLTKESIK